MDVNDAVLNFQAFLNAGYTAWHRSALVCLEKDRGFLDEAFFDWAQANWELIVERALCKTGEYLEIYAAGSDYETQIYSRVFFHHAKPTHEVFCESAAGTVVIDILSEREFRPDACSFDRFVSTKDTWYEDEPPFDHVLLEDGDTQYLAPVSFLKFRVRPIRTRPNQPLQRT